MEEMLYTVKEVAEILKTNTSYVYALKRAGKLKFMKIGSSEVPQGHTGSISGEVRWHGSVRSGEHHTADPGRY